MRSPVEAPRPAAVEPLEGRTLLAFTTFTIDPAQSQLAISGSAGTAFQLIEQAPGGLTTRYGGTIVADVTPGAIAFPGGSNIDAQPSGTYLPGNAPADYGLALSNGQATIAVRDLALDVTSAAPLPVSGTSFNSTGESLAFAAGTVALDAGIFGSQTVPLAGAGSVANGSIIASTIQDDGTGLLTLTIPVEASFQVADPSLPLPVQLFLVGDIVATGQLVTGPEVSVLNGSALVSNGQTVDFGSAAQGASAARTFTVRNDGTEVLTLGTVAAPAGFTIVQGLPASLAPGATASLQLALDTASAGSRAGTLTIPTNDADEASFTVNLSGTVTGAPAEQGVALTGVTLTAPARVIGGDRKAKATVSVQLANQTSTAFSGPVTITLLASQDAVPSPATDVQLAQVTKNLKFKAAAAGKPLKLKVQIPAVPADGDFFVVATATGGGVNAGQASAASGSTVRIEEPVVDLVGSGSPAPVALTLGKAGSLAIPLTNNGNVAAKGSVNLDLLISPDGTAASAVPLAMLPAKVAINPGATKPVKVKATLPPAGGLVQPGSFFLLVRVNGVGPLATLNASDGELLTPIPVSLV